MNSAKLQTTGFWLLALQCAILLCMARPVHAFTTAEEYLAHTGGAESCSTEKCHSDLQGDAGQSQHEPVTSGSCSACHMPDFYPNKFGLDTDQRKSCAACHKLTESLIATSGFVHGPIQNGDCTSCHDPHISAEPFLLKQPYSELCYSCHNMKRIYTGESVHKPVKDGNCGLCHDPHASANRSRLTDVTANLCVICHDDMVSGMAEEHIHAPITEAGCYVCHDPHAGKNSLRLRESKEKICFSCHKDKQNEIKQYANSHEPAKKGQCLSCHSPHFSKSNFLLKDKVDNLCYTCHKESSIWTQKEHLHGPVVQGNCSACHNPHGSDNAYILRLSFPDKFYTNYEEGKYDLCFLCHKEALVTTEKTEMATRFRNGDVNLHRLHVHQQKGRSCRACHDVHASDIKNHLREEFKFGLMTLPLYYTATETGGTCTPACHTERKYDRVDAVINQD